VTNLFKSVGWFYFDLFLIEKKVLGRMVKISVLIILLVWDVDLFV